MEKVRYSKDCIRIKNIAEKLGYDCSLREAEELWETYSEDKYCAGWLILPEEDEQIIEAIEEYYRGK